MLTIRREEPDDAEAVARVHVHGWQAGYAGFMPDEVLGRLNVVAWAQRRRDIGTADPEHPFTTLLGEVDGLVVGFATFGPYRRNQDRDDLDPAVGEVLALYVEPACWGDGTAAPLPGPGSSSGAGPATGCGCWRTTGGPAGSTSGPGCHRTVSGRPTRCPSPVGARRSGWSSCGTPAASTTDPPGVSHRRIGRKASSARLIQT